MKKKVIISLIFLLILSSIAYADITTDCTNVAALYHFDGDVNDSSGNLNHGTIIGATQTTGKLNQAYYFDGDDDYIQLNSALETLSDFTITGWIKMNSNASTEVNGNNPFWAIDGNNRVLITPSSNYLAFNGYIGGPSTDSNIDVWVHIAITREGSTARYYRNSINLDKWSDTWDVGLNSVDFSSSLIGNQGGYYFNGLIDEYIIYNKALNQSEVSELYNSGLAGTPVSCGPCIPNCVGKQCGSDGCGGSCGSCGGATPVCNNGVCEAQSSCIDNDGDGYNTTSVCGGVSNVDCDDTNIDVNPGATEGPFGDVTCSDTFDNNCDGNTDSADSNCIVPPTGNIYYASSTGTATWSQCTNIVTPCSLNTANSNAVAGDTIYLRAGTYNGIYINPSNSGTASQRITYQNYGSEVVTIQDATYGIHLNGKSYIKVQGINFYNLDKFLWFENNADYNIIAYNIFDQSRNIGWSGSKIYRSSSYNWIHHNTFSKYGECTVAGSDEGSVLDIGNENVNDDFSNYNLIEDNTLFHGGHHILGVYGMYNIIRNNYLHNEAWTRGKGNRNIYLGGYPASSGRNLIEGNRIGYSYIPCDSWGVSGMSLATGYNIVRKNSFFYNDLAGLEMSVTSTYNSDIIYNKIYNNAFLHNGWNMATGPDPLTSAIGFAIYDGPLIITGNAVKNNIYYDHYQVYGAYNVNLGDQIFDGNWDGDTQGDPLFVDASLTPGNPMDSSLPNMNLQSNSPAINSGGFLTTITSLTGSGTTFTVDDAGYFMNGWGIIEGDIIQLKGSTQRVKIINVDYTTNTITVASSLTWTQGQGISLSYEGSAPDAGAYEYTPQGNVIPAASCSYADVSSAIASANPGDTVVVPAGTCTWVSTLIIDKDLILKGAGVGNTIISTSMPQTIRWYVSGDEIIDFSGFEFNGNGLAAGGSGQNSIFYISNNHASVAATLKFYNNKLNDLADGGTAIRIQGGDVYGVVYNNDFIDVTSMARITNQKGDCQGWDPSEFYPFNYGNEMGVEYGNENLYFEDNNISFTRNVGDWAWIESGQGGRYAVRYNNYNIQNHNGVNGELWDIHNNKVGQTGGFGCEVYGNKIINMPGKGVPINQRDGECLVFNNIFDSEETPQFKFTSQTASGCDYDWTYWSSCGSPTMHISNTYYFNNERADLTEINPVLFNPDRCVEPDHLDLNEDWWIYDATCTTTDCATGIGIGSSPPTGTCNPGVAYWVTSANPATIATTDPNIIQNSKLYKCTSTNNWEVFYEPYTYPHPLRNEASTCNDGDNDGYGNPASSSCTNSGLDCNDNNPSINPGATETCNLNIDDNCDGIIQCHNADYLIVDGCVDENEVDAFVQRWFVSSADVSMSQLISAIRVWKQGCN